MGQNEVMTVAGLLLAAGAGRRMGRPKALVEGWLPSAVAALRDGGCDRVLVVLGAEAERAASLVPVEDRVSVLVASDWARGMGASLAAGLVALRAEGSVVTLVSLVDLPDVGADVVARVLGAGPLDAGALRRACYGGEPGHPVVLGSAHWPGVLASIEGDRGARGYLRVHRHDLVECADLATGRDMDHRPVLSESPGRRHLGSDR